MKIKIHETYIDFLGNEIFIYEKLESKSGSEILFFGDVEYEHADSVNEDRVQILTDVMYNIHSENSVWNEFIFREDGKSLDCDTYDLLKKKEKMSKITELVSEIAKEGTKDGSALAISGEFTKLLREKLGKNYPKFFNTSLGKSCEALLIPGLLIAICEIAPQVPQRDNLKFAAEHAMRAAVSIHVNEVLADLLPLLTQLANINQD